MIYIVCDTETSSLLALEAAGQEAQPEIIEFAAIKLNHELLPIDALRFYLRPKGRIHPAAEKVHGLSTERLQNEKPFVAYYNELVKFFVGVTYWIGYNAPFDKHCLAWELQRIGKQINFPYPPYDICVMNYLEQQKGYRISLSNAYTETFGETFVDAHSALSDCEATAKLFRRLSPERIMNTER